MDLVAGVRKEGSRGGRDSFKWSDVKESSHRENYLGHSIMAPVGRWQQNRDLNWYAKSGDAADDKAKQEREEEIRRIKEAEQDAMALALGLPVAPRASNNANMVPLGGTDVRKAVQESTEMDDKGDGDGGRGIGFGSYGGAAGAMNDAEDEILAPIGMDAGARTLGQEKDRRDRESRSHRSRRDRSRDHGRRRDREHRDRGGRHRHDQDADREHRNRPHREHREHRRHKSRSRSVSRSPRPERRDRRPEADRRRDAGRSGRHRSGSPRRDRGDHESGRDRHHRR